MQRLDVLPLEVNFLQLPQLLVSGAKPYGTLSCYKARLVVNGSTQVADIDVDETYSPVVKPGTIRIVLIYMSQPLGFQDSTHPHYVCLLHRSLYDLKKAPRIGDIYCLFTIVLYVDDIVLTAFSQNLLQQLISSLHQEFSMTV
ncbi:ribonuclease H-like domain-containing protein [Tanacetum coccineum]